MAKTTLSDRRQNASAGIEGSGDGVLKALVIFRIFQMPSNLFIPILEKDVSFFPHKCLVNLTET